MKIYKILQVSTGKYFDDYGKWSDKPRIYSRKNFAESSLKSACSLVNEDVDDIRIVEEEYELFSEKIYKPYSSIPDKTLQLKTKNRKIPFIPKEERNNNVI